MKTVTSKDNPILKAARKLLTRKGREEAGAFLVPGRKLIGEAVSAGFEQVHVFVNAGALARGEEAAGEYANEIALDERLFQELAQTVSPQPHIAVFRRRADRPRLGDEARELSETTEGAARGAARILILDRIGDPGNVGTMIRTALAAGMDGVWCVKGTAEVFSDKAIRASAGAVFHVAADEGLTTLDCIRRARGMNAKLFVCGAGGEDLYNITFPERAVFVIGNEGDGVQSAFLEAADGQVGIPMAAASESLNAAAAAAIVMYEALRQNRVDECAFVCDLY